MKGFRNRAADRQALDAAIPAECERSRIGAEICISSC